MCPTNAKPRDVDLMGDEQDLPVVDDIPISDQVYLGGAKLAKQLAQIRLAGEASMVEDARAVLKLNRANTYNIPIAPDEPGIPIEVSMAAGEEAMHIGDVNHHHHPAPEQKTTVDVDVKADAHGNADSGAPVTNGDGQFAPQQQPKKPSTFRKMLPTLITGAAIATGLGGGGLLVANSLGKIHERIDGIEDTDTDTQYQLEIVD